MPLPVFDDIEYVCIVIFTVEYLCRLLTVHAMVPSTVPRPQQAEKSAFLRPIFNRFDADQDGVVSVEELLAIRDALNPIGREADPNPLTL